MPNPYLLPAFYIQPLDGNDSYALARIYAGKGEPIQAKKYYLKAIALGVFWPEIPYIDVLYAGTQFLTEGNYSAAVNCYSYVLLKESALPHGSARSNEGLQSLRALKRLHRAGYVFDTQLPGFAQSLTKLPRCKDNTSGHKTRAYDRSDLRKEVLLKKVMQEARNNLPKEMKTDRENGLLAHLSIDEYYAIGLRHQEYAAGGKKTGAKLENIIVTEMYAARCFLHAAAQGDSSALMALFSYIASDRLHLPPNIDNALTQFRQILYPQPLNILEPSSSSDPGVGAHSSTLLLSKSSFWQAQSSQIAPPTPAHRTEVDIVSHADDSVIYIAPETTEIDINEHTPSLPHVDNEPEADIVVPAGETDSDLTLQDEGFETDSGSSLSSSDEEDSRQYTNGLSR